MLKKFLYLFVVSIGLLQIIGFVTKNKAIRGVGVAISSSPLPLVFTKVKDVETFSNQFFIDYTTKNNQRYSLKITPEVYSKIEGAYNRRNVYGAAFAYAPVLDKKLLDAVLSYAFCDKNLTNEIGIPNDAKNFSVRIVSQTNSPDKVWNFKPNCNDEKL